MCCRYQGTRTGHSSSWRSLLWCARRKSLAEPQHWSARSPKDTNASLWAGFHVRSESETPRSFLHLGDTG